MTGREPIFPFFFRMSRLANRSKLIFITDCANVTCQNGGKCVNQMSTFSCTCVHGFSGKYCEQGKCNNGVRFRKV